MSLSIDIFECTMDAVIGVDKDMRIRFINKPAEELFDKTEEQVLGRSCHDVICGRDLLGNDYCNEQCTISSHHDASRPNPNWDLIIRRGTGDNVVVNIGTYYLNKEPDGDDRDIHAFHSMRVIDCPQIIRRFAFNSSPTKDDNPIKLLSKREHEVLRLISSGVKAKDIASRLGISHATVRNHTKNIYAKLEVHSKAEVINYAMRHGVL